MLKKIRIQDPYWRFIRQLSTAGTLWPQTGKQGGGRLKDTIEFKQRKKLEEKMANVFKENLVVLPTELRRILVDDLVTAFQNRMYVLMRAQRKRGH